MAKRWWKNKSKYCWVGSGEGMPVPHELHVGWADGTYFPPEAVKEADIDGRMREGPRQVVVMFGPAEVLDAEVKALGIPASRFIPARTKTIGDKEYRCFKGAEYVLEDVSADHKIAVQSAQGLLDSAKALSAKDATISELQGNLAAAMQKVKELEVELASAKAERSKSARSRLGL